MKLRPGVILLTSMMVVPLLGGCIASVKVTKVPVNEAEPGVAGVRYSLPASFLVVEPDPAKPGGYTVETKLFPDATETYAIASMAYLSTATLNVELAEGLLTKVTINQNTGDVGTEALKGISEVVKADLEQEKKEKEAAETADKEAAKELAALEAAVIKAEDELLVARRSVAEWELLVSTPGGESNQTYQLGLRQAKIDLAKAEIALQRANQALAERQAQTSGGGGGGVQDSVEIADGGGSGQKKDENAKAPDQPTRKGPVVYRLVDTCDVWSTAEVFNNCKVELVPVQWNLKDSKDFKDQLDLQVRAITSKPAEPKQPELVDVQITPEPVVFSKGVFKKVLVLSTPVCSIDSSQSTLKTVDSTTGEEESFPLSKVGLTLQTGKANVELVVREGALKAATYYLTLQILYGDCKPGKSESAPVAYQFRIGR